MKTKILKLGVTLILIMAVFFLFGRAKNQTTALIIGSGKAKPLSTLTIPVNLANIPGKNVSSINFDLHYDASQLTFDKAVAGKIVTDASKSLTTSSPLPGQLRVIIFGLNQNPIANGTLAHLSFRVNAGARAQKAALHLGNAVTSDPQAKSVPLTLKDGLVAITAP